MMGLQLPSIAEGDRCDGCGRHFIRESSLTNHRNKCTATLNHSRKLWKNGPANIKKLSLSLMGNSRKREREEDQPHANFQVQVAQSNPPSVDIRDSNTGLELVCMPSVVF